MNNIWLPNCFLCIHRFHTRCEKSLKIPCPPVTKGLLLSSLLSLSILLPCAVKHWPITGSHSSFARVHISASRCFRWKTEEVSPRLGIVYFPLPTLMWVHGKSRQKCVCVFCWGSIALYRHMLYKKFQSWRGARLQAIIKHSLSALHALITWTSQLCNTDNSP